MKTTVQYKDLDTAATKAKALEDIKEYLGTRRFNRIVETMKDSPQPQEGFAMACGLLLGIEGYPVTVFYEHIYGVEWVYEKEDS